MELRWLPSAGFRRISCCVLLITAAGVLNVAAASDNPAPPAVPAVAAGNDVTSALPAQLDAANQTLLRLTDEQRYEEAATLAARAVELTRQVHGPDSIELAAPLNSLAALQLRQGKLVEAEASYQESRALIEKHEGLASPRLIVPLAGLGETYLRAGLYAEARDAYERALRTNHVQGGFYNLEQLPIMDGLSEAYLGLDKLDQANAQQRTQVLIQRRRAAGNEAGLAPALEKLGRWYNRTGQYPQAREAYQMARRTLRESGQGNDAAVVDTLIGEARTYTNEGQAPASAASLKRALDVLDSQPEPNHLKRAEVLIELGDLYVLTRQPRAARERYQQAWRELSGDPALEEQRERYLGQAARIAGPRLPVLVGDDGKERTATDSAASTAAPGLVLASLTVREDGEAKDLKIIESQPPGLLDEKVLRVLADTAFRPRLADGVTVASTGVQFRHEFRYFKTQATTDKDSDDAPASGEPGERIGYPEQDNAGQREGQR